MAIKLEVEGEYALFTRPEMKVERVSYDVMTPSAARGILEAVFWHPGMRWCVDRIRVCSPIRFCNIRRNEVESVISSHNVRKVLKSGKGKLYILTPECRQQRAAMILRNVHYVIEAHFEMTQKASKNDNPGKFQEMMRRRMDAGQCYHMPYLGTREFPARFYPCKEIPPCPEELLGEIDLGFMLWDMDYSDPSDIKPLFFRPRMVNGVITVPDRASGEVIG